MGGINRPNQGGLRAVEFLDCHADTPRWYKLPDLNTQRWALAALAMPPLAAAQMLTRGGSSTGARTYTDAATGKQVVFSRQEDKEILAARESADFEGWHVAAPRLVDQGRLGGDKDGRVVEWRFADLQSARMKSCM